MKKDILIKPYSGDVFLNNRVFKTKLGSNIFFGFKKKLAKYGININTMDIKIKERPDKIVYCDIPYPWEVRFWLMLLLNTDKSILITFESPIINPFSQMRLFSFLFKRIYTWNDKLVDNKKYFKFYIPQLDSDLQTKPVLFKNKKFLTLINANKSVPLLFRLFSFNYKDLYKERLKAINYFEENLPSDFTLYGYGWKKSEHPAYKGEIGNKFEVLSKYKYCICYENTLANGYITEKIFDCFKAKCVPIYWGNEDLDEHIPSTCYINYGDFMDYEKLYLYLMNISEDEYNLYIEEIEKFLYNKRTQSLWFEKGFEKFFINAINK